MTFEPIEDFDHRSYSHICPMTQLPKQSKSLNKQAHEVDEFILRGPELLAHDGRGPYSIGFLDVRPAVIRETAAKYLGMVGKEEVEVLRDTVVALKSTLEVMQKQNDSYKDQVRGLTIQNAEQIVQIEAATAELEAVYEETYGESFSEDVLDQNPATIDLVLEREDAS